MKPMAKLCFLSSEWLKFYAKKTYFCHFLRLNWKQSIKRGEKYATINALIRRHQNRDANFRIRTGICDHNQLVACGEGYLESFSALASCTQLPLRVVAPLRICDYWMLVQKIHNSHLF
jgi:hypothetical protein